MVNNIPNESLAGDLGSDFARLSCVGFLCHGLPCRLRGHEGMKQEALCSDVCS